MVRDGAFNDKNEDALEEARERTRIRRVLLENSDYNTAQKIRKHPLNVTCNVCYEEVLKIHMVSLNCEHEFCYYCVKDHITSNVDSGKAITIKCMEANCPERYSP